MTEIMEATQEKSLQHTTETIEIVQATTAPVVLSDFLAKRTSTNPIPAPAGEVPRALRQRRRSGCASEQALRQVIPDARPVTCSASRRGTRCDGG